MALTDANGVVVDRYAYDQWGEETSDDRVNEHVPQQLRYKGLYYDERIQWYWDAGRYYDPETERYLQPEGDPSFIFAGDKPASTVSSAGRCKVQVRFERLPGFIGANLGFNHAYVTISDGHKGWKTEAKPQNGGGALTVLANPGFLTPYGPTELTGKDLVKDTARGLATLDFPKCTKSCRYYYLQLRLITHLTRTANIGYFPGGFDLYGNGLNSNAYAYTVVDLLGGDPSRFAPVPAPGWGHHLCIGPYVNSTSCQSIVDTVS